MPEKNYLSYSLLARASTSLSMRHPRLYPVVGGALAITTHLLTPWNGKIRTAREPTLPTGGTISVSWLAQLTPLVMQFLVRRGLKIVGFYFRHLLPEGEFSGVENRIAGLGCGGILKVLIINLSFSVGRLCPQQWGIIWQSKQSVRPLQKGQPSTALLAEVHFL